MQNLCGIKRNENEMFNLLFSHFDLFDSFLQFGQTGQSINSNFRNDKFDAETIQ